MKKLSTELITQVVELRQQKLPIASIAQRLGIGSSSVEHALKLGGAVKKRLTQAQREEIRAKRLDGIQIDALCEEYGVSSTTIFDTTRGLDLSHLKIDQDGVVSDYEAGMSHKEIAAKHGVKTRSVGSILARANVQKRVLSEQDKKRLLTDRQAGMSRQDLALKYKLTEGGVKSVLSRAGVVLDPELTSANTAKGRIRAYLAGQNVTNHEELMARYASERGGHYLGGYSGVLNQADWKCAGGHEFAMRPNSVQQGQWCPQCSHVGPSRGQLAVSEYVKSLGFSVDVGNRTVLKSSVTNRALEIDVWVPDKKLAIEFNGLIWHSEKFTESGRHCVKAEAARNAGIGLFAFFEDEWETKGDLVKAMIRHRLGILGQKVRASKLELRKLLKNDDFKAFFERNHLDGHVRASYAYGLFLGQKLIACLSIRTNHQGEREIARFATDYDYHVHGGAGRLVKAALSNESALFTFSNNRLSVGDVYAKLGFALVQENGPSYWYTDGKERVWRYRCRRVNDPEVLKNFPEVGHTERAQAEAGVLSIGIWGDRRKLWKIEDYGHRKWVWELDTGPKVRV